MILRSDGIIAGDVEIEASKKATKRYRGSSSKESFPKCVVNVFSSSKCQAHQNGKLYRHQSSPLGWWKFAGSKGLMIFCSRFHGEHANMWVHYNYGCEVASVLSLCRYPFPSLHLNCAQKIVWGC